MHLAFVLRLVYASDLSAFTFSMTTRKYLCLPRSSAAAGRESRVQRVENDYNNTQPVIRAIGVSHTACEDEFRQNIRSHSWSVF